MFQCAHALLHGWRIGQLICMNYIYIGAAHNCAAPLFIKTIIICAILRQIRLI